MFWNILICRIHVGLGCTTELSFEGLQFLKLLFQKYDEVGLLVWISSYMTGVLFIFWEIRHGHLFNLNLTTFQGMYEYILSLTNCLKVYVTFILSTVHVCFHYVCLYVRWILSAGQWWILVSARVTELVQHVSHDALGPRCQ
jgi:hypothetical protein